MAKRTKKSATEKVLMVRQGDVLVVRRSGASLDGATEIPREGGRVVLAHGEATGHAHAIREPEVRMFRVGEDREVDAAVAHAMRIIALATPATIRHEEHAAIDLPPDNYEVIRQKEYAPESIRNVAD